MAASQLAAVLPPHEAPPALPAMCVAAAMKAHLIDDYLFCHELLCAEALDLHHDPSFAWPSSECGYGDHLSSNFWSSSPSLQLHSSWSSSLLSLSSYSSLSSSSPFPFDDDLHYSECGLQHSDERLTDSSAGSKLISSSSCSAGSDIQGSSFPGEFHEGLAGSCCGSAMQGEDFAAEEGHGCERMNVLLERQRWKHCRPLKEYAESMRWNDVYEAKQLVKHCAAGYTIAMCRRREVQWMLEVGRVMHVRLSSVAQAVTYLDRYLDAALQAKKCHVPQEEHIHVASVACLWIALKMEHSNAPDAALMIQSIVGLYHYTQEEAIATLKTMEASVLQVLEWRLLGVSCIDFVDSILPTLQAAPSSTNASDLSAVLIPNHLINSLESRVHEIIQGTFLEVEFAGYEALVVGLCAIQHAVEESMPLQATSIMKIIEESVASSLDMEEVCKCYRTMGDLVIDPLTTSSIDLASPISHNMIYEENTILGGYTTTGASTRRQGKHRKGWHNRGGYTTTGQASQGEGGREIFFRVFDLR
ncbi:hypothetical protein GOP47_0014523 [Adiantum capillus-veneris]|uniref:Cyclin N-terminal domain-containing protein n=1 Tax=Adiantum capillus-veneris TaxID=13818 RepID=A0A9D4ZE90_ADICA|nr:hypothetical protein GOP47_0014523 [Adiantum capillus-veneris]